MIGWRRRFREPSAQGWPGASVLPILFLVTACHSVLTVQRINEVQPGQSTTEVQNRWGAPVRMEEVTNDVWHGQIFHYPVAGSAPGSELCVYFLNDRVLRVDVVVPGPTPSPTPTP